MGSSSSLLNRIRHLSVLLLFLSLANPTVGIVRGVSSEVTMPMLGPRRGALLGANASTARPTIAPKHMLEPHHTRGPCCLQRLSCERRAAYKQRVPIVHWEVEGGGLRPLLLVGMGGGCRTPKRASESSNRYGSPKKRHIIIVIAIAAMSAASPFPCPWLTDRRKAAAKLRVSGGALRR